MAYPSDVYLPPNAKYFGFVDTSRSFNSHWDIIWSITFALTGTDHAFCTFLTTTPTISSAIPGQYLGYIGDKPYILNENFEILHTEDEEKILYDLVGGSFEFETTGILAIAFDSTGYFALSNNGTVGIPISETKRNSLIIRDCDNNVVFNECLSSLNTNFFLASATKNYQTLRFRLSNAGKRLHIDFKTPTTSYTPLTSLDLSRFDANIYPTVYAGLTFCSPVSSNNAPSTLYLKNFNYEGDSEPETYEIVPTESIYPDSSAYTSVSAFPTVS